jgi:hypothetical protein
MGRLLPAPFVLLLIRSTIIGMALSVLITSLPWLTSLKFNVKLKLRQILLSRASQQSLSALSEMQRIDHKSHEFTQNSKW